MYFDNERSPIVLTVYAYMRDVDVMYVSLRITQQNA